MVLPASTAPVGAGEAASLIVPPLLLPAPPDQPALVPISSDSGSPSDTSARDSDGGDAAPPATAGSAIDAATGYGPFMVKRSSMPDEYQRLVQQHNDVPEASPRRRRRHRKHRHRRPKSAPSGSRRPSSSSSSGVSTSGSGTSSGSDDDEEARNRWWPPMASILENMWPDEDTPRSAAVKPYRKGRLTPSMRALNDELSPEMRRMGPVQRLRHHMASRPRNDGLRIGGRVRHVKAPPPSTPHFRRDAARVHAQRDTEGSKPYTQITAPSNPIIAQSREQLRSQPRPRSRRGARARLGVSSRRVADVLMQGSRTRALPRAHVRTFAIDSPEALGIPKYDAAGKKVKKLSAQVDPPVDTARDPSLDLTRLKERYKTWREPDTDVGCVRRRCVCVCVCVCLCVCVSVCARTAHGCDSDSAGLHRLLACHSAAQLDEEFEEQEAKFKEENKRRTAMKRQQRKWRKHMEVVNVFRRMEFDGQRVGESRDRFVSDVQPQYDGVVFDDTPGRRWSPPSSPSSLTSDDSDSDNGVASGPPKVALTASVADGADSGDDDLDGVTMSEPEPRGTARSRKSSGSKGGRRSGAKTDVSDDSGSGGESAPRTGRSAQQIEASRRKWAILYDDMEGVKEEGEGEGEGQGEAAGAGKGETDAEADEQLAAEPVQAVHDRMQRVLKADVDAFPQISAFGPNPSKRLGLQEDIFAKFRNEDTTMCDSFWGTVRVGSTAASCFTVVCCRCLTHCVWMFRVGSRS